MMSELENTHTQKNDKTKKFKVGLAEDHCLIVLALFFEILKCKVPLKNKSLISNSKNNF